jgi:hypothetical protein
MIENLKLNWSAYKIAKNLNFYRYAEPTEQFWENWKTSKDLLKSEGISVRKEDSGKFLVYDWSRQDKAPMSNYITQEANKERKKKIWEEVIEKYEFDVYYEEIMSTIESQLDDCRATRKLIRAIETTQSVDDIYCVLVGELCDDADSAWEPIQREATATLEAHYRRRLEEAGLSE